MSDAGFPAALERWRTELGADAVRTDAATLARYARTTLPHGAAPAAVLLPESTAQVQGIVRVAGAHGVSLHPISRGKNWGYGDACPPTAGQAIVDLQRMNRILEVDDRLAYAVVEPGVTQGQLYDHLRQHHPHLWMDATGAGLGASIIGNILDRGFGHTPAGDHARNTCALEVVLGDGQVLQTGLAHLPGPRPGVGAGAGAETTGRKPGATIPGAHARHAYPYGIGPWIDGLFTQANFGIVTRATVWLTPAPEAFCAFYVVAESEGALSDLIDRFAALRMAGLLRSAVHVANDLRTIASFVDYPWDRTGGRTPIPADLRAQLRRESGLGAWNVSGGIYGTKGTAAATKAAIRKALSGRGFKIRFLDDRLLGLAEGVTRRLTGLGMGRRYDRMLRVIRPTYGLLKGIPTDEFLAGVAWSVRPPDTGEPAEGGAPPEPTAPNPKSQIPNPKFFSDPLDQDVGLIWVSPVVPAVGEHATAVVALMEPIFARHGFDLQITMSLVTDRALTFVTNISFDRRVPEQTAKAEACYDEVVAALLKAGYPPYRASPQGAAKIVEVDTPFWGVARQIKKALDPKGVISPGRYGL